MNAVSQISGAEPAIGSSLSRLRVVHLPFYDDNPYQSLLLNALRNVSVDATPGGGGGNFFRTALLRWKPDVLHFHWLHPYLLRQNTSGTLLRGGRFLAEIAALKQAGIRIVWTVHNLANHERRQALWERRLTQAFARMADGIVVHGEAARQGLSGKFKLLRPERLVVIAHGHYIDAYENVMSRDAARSALGLSSDQFVLTLLGRLRPYKGLDELLSAFTSWAEPQAALVIAGSAEADLRDELLAAAAVDSRILVRPSRIDDDEVQVFLNAADAVVLPYRDVLTSGSAILAMSFGRACVAPALGCLPEHLGGGNIFYGTAGCPDLGAALRTAFKRRSELAEVGRSNHERALAWSWERVAQDTRRLYERVLCGQKSLTEMAR